jgi:hypothetical protein
LRRNELVLVVVPLVSREKYRVFVDLFDMATFFVPSTVVPDLPEDLKHRLQ